MKGGNDICMHSLDRLVPINSLKIFGLMAEIPDYFCSLGAVLVHSFPKYLVGIVTALL